jgi:hypothetical protein
MYKFQKVNLSYNGISIDYDWMLVIESLEDLISYHENTLKAQIPFAWENLLKTHSGHSHICTTLGLLINHQAKVEKGKRSLFELTRIVGEKIFEAKATTLLNTGKIYINNNGGFFPHSKDITVLEEISINSDKLIFPQYTEKDIKIKKWENGKHYYAYVGSFQVEMHGENKWNTEQKALDMAKAFLYGLRNKQYEIKE